MTIMTPGVNPFIFTPDCLTMEILKYCGGNETAAISSVCKLFADLEKQETIWKGRMISLMGEDLGNAFFVTYKSWKNAYIQLFHMRRIGKVLSPTELVDFDGNIRRGSFLNGKLQGNCVVRFVNGNIWKGNFVEDELVKGEIIIDNGEMVKHIDKKREEDGEMANPEFFDEIIRTLEQFQDQTPTA